MNNGLNTKCWGPPLWVSLHSITFGYPVKPTEKHKRNYKQFIVGLKNVLPCKYCRDSYTNFLKEINIDNYLDSRKTLTKFMYLIHEKVNNKLGVPSCKRPTFKMVEKKYESMRAKCKPTTDEERIKNATQGCVIPTKKNKKKKCVIKFITIQ